MKTILITNQKGGVGKSTIAFNIAQNICLSTKVVLVDLDPQGSLIKLSETLNIEVITINKISELQNIEADYLIIDTPPYLSKNLVELITFSDIILIPTKVGVLDLYAIDDTIKLIKEVNCQEKSLIVFNMVKPNTTLTKDIKEKIKELGIPLAQTILSDKIIFIKSFLLQGVEKDSKAQKQIDSLTKEILIKLTTK